MRSIIEERKATLILYGESKAGAEVYFREDWDCYYFSLNGKCFARMDDVWITLKGDPQENIALREKYDDVIPGYYANKTHWISIKLDTNELTTEDIKAMINISYNLVIRKLTHKEQMNIYEK